MKLEERSNEAKTDPKQNSLFSAQGNYFLDQGRMECIAGLVAERLRRAQHRGSDVELLVHDYEELGATYGTELRDKLVEPVKQAILAEGWLVDTQSTTTKGITRDWLVARRWHQGEYFLDQGRMECIAGFVAERLRLAQHRRSDVEPLVHDYEALGATYGTEMRDRLVEPVKQAILAEGWLVDTQSITTKGITRDRLVARRPQTNENV